LAQFTDIYKTFNLIYKKLPNLIIKL